MGNKSKGILIGGGIILIGFLALISNLNIISFGTRLFWIIIFAGSGFALFTVFQRDTSKWGVLIPVGLLWVIALSIGISIIPGASGDIFWSVLILGFGLTFIFIYVKQKNQWWAIIPGGVFITIACMAFIEDFRLLDAEFRMFTFFLGIGLTFGFLYLIRDEENKLQWAKYPAVCLLILSFLNLFLIEGSLFADLLFPISLILVGGIILIKALMPSKSKS